MTEPKISDALKTMLGLDYFEAGDKASGTVIAALAVLAFLAAYFGFTGMAFLLALAWGFLISGGVSFIIPRLAGALSSSRTGTVADVRPSVPVFAPPDLNPAPPETAAAVPAEILVLNGDALETHIELTDREPADESAAPPESESPRLAEVLASFRDEAAEPVPPPPVRKRRGPAGAP